MIELFQEWALIFQSDPSLSYLYDVYINLKTSKRVIFPKPSKNLDLVDPLSIVSTLAPPEWTDSPNCQRCRDAFTMTNRKHHCRKCGGTFCQLCSSNEMVLLEMGINEPVRVCDSCYKNPPEKEKRKAKLIERKPFEETDDPELKKAIELSLKEQSELKSSSGTEKIKQIDEEEALKKAIEASLKEVGPSHLQNLQNQPDSNEKRPKIKYFSDLEVENVNLFHQLIGRLVRTKPTMNPDDAEELKKLAAEMRCLLKRPIESDALKKQLIESLQGFDSMFSNVSNVQQPPESVTSSSDLSRMRNDIFSKSPEPVVSLVRNRLGSMSLENTTDSNVPTELLQANNPIPSISPFQNHHRHTINGPIAFSSPFALPQTQMFYPNYHTIMRPPMPMCPDMTIHPHPIHPPMAHVNPYAKNASVESEEKEKSKKKKLKNSKKDDSKKTKPENKRKEKSEAKQVEEPAKKKSKNKDKIKSKDEKDSHKVKEKLLDEKGTVSSKIKKEKRKSKNVEEPLNREKASKITLIDVEEDICKKDDEKKTTKRKKIIKDDKLKVSEDDDDKLTEKHGKRNAETLKEDKSGKKRMKNGTKKSRSKKEPPNLIDL